MRTGMNFFDPNGKLLIDTNSLYYGLVKSGPIRSDLPNIGGYNVGTSGFSVNAIAPIVFVEGGAAVISSTRSGNEWKFYISPLYPMPVDGSSGYDVGWPEGIRDRYSTDVRFYVFDLMRSNKSGTGLEIFREDGKVIFNSDQWPMNVVASIRSPAPYGPNGLPYTADYGWVMGGTVQGAHFGYTCSASMELFGLSAYRRYAFHSPWSRGGGGYGAGDNYPIWESYVTLQGRIGFCWTSDPYLPPQMSDAGWWPAYAVHENRAALSIVDVTDLPYPFDYGG